MTPPDTRALSQPLTIVGVTVGGLQGVAANFRAFALAALAPVVVNVVAVTLLRLAGVDEAPTVPIRLAAGLLSLIAMLLILSLSVSWQRFLLLGERPSPVYFGGGFWRYLGASSVGTVGLLLITALIATPVFILWGTRLVPADLAPGDPGMLRQLTPLLGTIAACSLPGIWWYMRLTPYFTARCVGDGDLSWTESFRLMNGHVPAYLLAVLGTAVPTFGVELAATAAIIHFGTGLPIALLVLLRLVEQSFGIAWIAALSSVGALVYKQLVIGDAPQYPDPAIRHRNGVNR